MRIIILTLLFVFKTCGQTCLMDGECTKQACDSKRGCSEYWDCCQYQVDESTTCNIQRGLCPGGCCAEDPGKCQTKEQCDMIRGVFVCICLCCCLCCCGIVIAICWYFMSQGKQKRPTMPIPQQQMQMNYPMQSMQMGNMQPQMGGQQMGGQQMGQVVYGQ